MRIYVQLMKLITPYSLQWVNANLRSADGTVFPLQLTNESMQIYIQLTELISPYSLQWVNADLCSADGTDSSFSLSMSQCRFTFSWWNWFPLAAYNEPMRIYVQLTALFSPYSLQWVNANLRSADGTDFSLKYCMLSQSWHYGWITVTPLVTHSKHGESTQKCNQFTLSKGVTIISALNRSAQEDKLWINRPDRNFYLVFQALDIVLIRSRQKLWTKYLMLVYP
jgi:hypothetical protein